MKLRVLLLREFVGNKKSTMVGFAQREAYETGRIAEPMLNFFLAGTGAKHNIFVDF